MSIGCLALPSPAPTQHSLGSVPSRALRNREVASPGGAAASFESWDATSIGCLALPTANISHHSPGPTFSGAKGSIKVASPDGDQEMAIREAGPVVSQLASLPASSTSGLGCPGQGGFSTESQQAELRASSAEQPDSHHQQSLQAEGGPFCTKALVTTLLMDFAVGGAPQLRNFLEEEGANISAYEVQCYTAKFCQQRRTSRCNSSSTMSLKLGTQ